MEYKNEFLQELHERNQKEVKMMSEDDFFKRIEEEGIDKLYTICFNVKYLSEYSATIRKTEEGKFEAIVAGERSYHIYHYISDTFEEALYHLYKCLSVLKKTMSIEMQQEIYENKPKMK